MTRRAITVLAVQGALLVWALVTVFPIAWILLSSLKMPNEVFATPPKWLFTPTMHNYEVILGTKLGDEFEGITSASISVVTSRFPLYLVNSVVVGSMSTLIALFLGIPAAYGFARFRFSGRTSLLIGVFLTRAVPPIVLVVPFYLLMRGVNLHDTRTGLILVYTTFTLPFVVWMMRAYILSIPAELEEAARIDGCSFYGAFWKIVVPLAMPGIVASAIFCFLLAWNEFLFAIVLTGEASKTASAAVVGFLTDKAILWGRLFAGGTLILLPALIISALIQRHLVQGATMGALKG